MHAEALPAVLRAPFRAEVLSRLAGPSVANGAVAAAILATLAMGYERGTAAKMPAMPELQEGEPHASP
jgi:hypothetical protein